LIEINDQWWLADEAADARRKVWVEKGSSR